MKKLLLFASIIISGISITQAQTTSAVKLEKSFIRQTVTDVANLLERNYVIREKGNEMKKYLLNNLKKGSYDKITNADQLAEQLKNELQAICNDKHVYLNILDPSSKISKPQASAVSYDRRAAAFQNVRILPGRVGYVEINHFLPTEVGAPDAIAIMSYLGKCDAIIFDLRTHRGGNGEMNQVILSYLFENPTLINTVYDRINDTTHQMWTHRVVSKTALQEYNPSTKMFTYSDSISSNENLGSLFKADVYVLTSDYTFSAGEEFAYDLQCQKRATLIGSTTGGGGNPTRFYPVNERFAISIPWAKSINPITNDGWEGKGVTPDVQVHPSKALETAHLLAVNKLMEKAQTLEAKHNLMWDLEVAKSLYAEKKDSTVSLQQFAGNYGEYQIVFEEGILYAKKGLRGRLPLVNFAPRTFQLTDDSKIVFIADSTLKVTGFEVVSKNGKVLHYKKQ